MFSEVAVKTLSNSQAFQRFALRTHEGVQKASKVAAERGTSVSQMLEQHATTARKFKEVFTQELEKDLKNMKK